MVVQRLLLALLAGLLLEMGATAVAGLIVPGSEPFILAACGAGLLLAGIWLWSNLGLLLAGALLSGAVGLITDRASHRLVPIHNPHALNTPVVALDPWASAVLVACATGIAVLSGWMLFRAREPWPVCALIGSCFLFRADVSVAYSDRFPLLICGLFVLVGLAYAGRARIARRLVLIWIFSAVSVSLGWLLPTSVPAWSQNLTDPVRSLLATRQEISTSNTLRLSGPFHPYNRVVMSVRLPGSLRPYWRNQTYDAYDGHSWHITGYRVDQVRPGFSLWADAVVQRNVQEATVVVREATDTLVFPGEPVSVDRSTLASVRVTDGEPLSVAAPSVMFPGSTYTVEGLVASPGAGGGTLALPSDLAPYLQLPAIPDEVRTLALRITSRGSTLARVLRVERYLASSGTFRYDENVGSSPDRDAVDDFLFHSRRGYCNQFATAMAVMLRASGIAARVVGGYVTGTRVGGQFVVRERDAHSWVEAYIPRSGWLQFEPTPRFGLDPRLTPHGAATRRPNHATSRTEPLPVPTPARVPVSPRPAPVQKPAAATASRPSVPTDIALLGLLALLVAGAAWIRRPRSVAQMYRRMARSRAGFSPPIRAHETPAEFAGRLSQRHRADAAIISELYARERYGQRAPDSREQGLAWQAWKRFRRARWLRNNGG